MRTLVILRPEIFSVIIMAFLIGYDRYCSKYRREKDVYFKFAMVCLGHCIFAVITEITVNMANIPVRINDICHVLFFLFSLLYSLFYFEYALGLIMPKSELRNKIMKIGYIICAIDVLVMLFSPIEYIQGENTKYSEGIGPTLCYMLGFALFLMADIIMIVNRKHINRAVIHVLLPLSFITLGLLTVQIIIPEFLYTAEALTLTAVGLFLAIENPVEKFKNRAFVDQNLQIWNRNCYEYDLKNIVEEKIEYGSRLACVIGDVNGLKRVNDNLGHLDGDRLLESISHIWQDELKSAYRCYRIGGDEFLALYFETNAKTIEKETEKAQEASCRLRFGDNIPVGISMGYAELGNNKSVDEMFRNAENIMYKNKKKYYDDMGLKRRID